MNEPQLNPGPATAAATWKQRYEALRQLAVADSQLPAVAPLGWVVLRRQGLAGWMRSWPGLTPASAGAAAPPPLGPVAPASPWQQSLTQLLAQMTLAHLPKAPAL